MAFPLYELFMETTPYPRSKSCGHERKGLRRSATYPDLRQARVNWRRYHIQPQPSIIQPNTRPKLQAQEKKHGHGLEPVSQGNRRARRRARQAVSRHFEGIPDVEWRELPNQQA